MTVLVRFNATADTVRGIARKDIRGLTLLHPDREGEGRLPAGSTAVVEQAAFRYRTAHFSGTLYQSNRVLDDLVDDSAYLATPPTRAELRSPRREDAEIATELIRHLNDRLELYHRVIWLNMDPERRYM
ncbi:MAG TPA: hypothetical protein VIG57_14110, partial [Candidatus Entotheonella sp.]